MEKYKIIIHEKKDELGKNISWYTIQTKEENKNLTSEKTMILMAWMDIIKNDLRNIVNKNKKSQNLN